MKTSHYQGCYTIKFNPNKAGKFWRVQISHPRVQIKKNDCFITGNTIIRMSIDSGYFGIGFEILGFGLAFDYGEK